MSMPETTEPQANASTPAVAAHDHGEEVELVSRPTQAGIGLFTGVILYSAAFGGIFALVFAFAYGRVGALQPRALAALLALAAFVVVVFVPGLKYPANPPSVGNGETIGYRTALFFAMLVASVFAAGFGVFVRTQLLPRFGAWNAALGGVAAFVVVAGGAMLLLPGINEVPEGFPATLLWQFRVASLGTQAILWTTLGLAFGTLTQRSLLRG
jgi:predicted cobalt transporter CbtA